MNRTTLLYYHSQVASIEIGLLVLSKHQTFGAGAPHPDEELLLRRTLRRMNYLKNIFDVRGLAIKAAS